MSLLLGIDVGTSATKGVVCDRGGRVIGVASAAYPLSQPRPGWSEQDPDDWWRGVVGVTRELLGRPEVAREGIGAVGLSGQMHGAVFLGRAAVQSRGELGGALRPAILWNDQRTAVECARIEAAVGGRRALVDLVGNAALPGFTLPKLLWVREHEPEVDRATDLILLPKDFIRLRLTGEAATDVGDASGMLLLDVDRRDWSAAALGEFKIPRERLARVVESAAVTGRVSAWAAGLTGLASGTPVVAGSGDNMAGAVGAGVVSAGMVLATIGTSGVIYAHAERARKDRAGETPGRVHTMCAATGGGGGGVEAGGTGRAGGWCMTGCMLSAGGSLRWCRDTLFPGVAYETLMGEAAGVAPGSGGLVFLPYLTGERCPYPDPRARGGWIGLTSRHTRGHLVRAVVEGVTFGMAQILGIVRGLGVEVGVVRLGGGGARSELWRQMQADVYGVPVAVTNTEEGPAMGAALLAGVGAGAWGSVEEACAATIAEVERREPRPGSEGMYGRARGVYDELYGDLRERCAVLGEVEAGGEGGA